MATKTIGGLTAGLAADLDDTALVPIRNNDSVDRKYTIAQLRTQINTGAQAITGETTLTGAGSNLVLATAGSGYKVKEGSNATMGTGTLSGLAATISTTKVTANSRIFVCYNDPDIVGSSTLNVKARVAGTSFDVVGSVNESFAWIIFEPS